MHMYCVKVNDALLSRAQAQCQPLSRHTQQRRASTSCPNRQPRTNGMDATTKLNLLAGCSPRSIHEFPDGTRSPSCLRATPHVSQQLCPKTLVPVCDVFSPRGRPPSTAWRASVFNTLGSPPLSSSSSSPCQACLRQHSQRRALLSWV